MIDHGDPVGLSGVQFGKHAEGVNHRHDHEYDYICYQLSNENKIWDNNVFTMYLYRQKWKKNPFKSNVPYFHSVQVTWKLTVCPLKFFGDHYLEFLMAQYFGSREKK